MAETTCSVDGCDRIILARGLCNAHYTRWRIKGDPGTAELRPSAKHVQGDTCSVDGCGRDVLVASRKLCQAHYKRWQRTGDPGGADLRPPSDGKITYRRIHEIVQKMRGHAAGFSCVECGDRAHEWAYDHLDPDQRVMPDDASQHAGFPYSLNVDHYYPMCRPCHRTADLNRAKSA